MQFLNWRKRVLAGCNTLLSHQIWRAMRMTFILLTAAFLQVSAKGKAQEKITLDLKNAPLEKVFTEIRKVTGYDFFYDDATIKNTRPVTISVKDATLKEVLDKCVEGQRLVYTISANSITVQPKPDNSTTQVSAPPLIDIRGKVVNEKKEPVEGASIKVKGTSRGTTTNSDGEFQLTQIDENAVLQISHVSIEPYELRINGRANLETIVVKTQVQENELVTVTVNTGLQQIPKERATGSFTHLSNSQINEQVGLNILNRINGVANGVLFDNNNQRPPITVRGLSTINGPKNPLIVVDNFPYEGDMNNINPNMVESITILKDAAAASIWGTRAGNGVIVITTKKGKFNQPLKLNFNSNVTFSSAPDLSYLKLMPTSDFIDVETFLFSKNFFNGQINNPGKPPLSPIVEILVKRKSGLISSADSAAQINALRNIDVRDDFDKNIYQTGINQQYYLSASGGTDQMTYDIAGGYDRNFSNTASKYERINLRSFNSFKPLKNLQVSTNLFYTQSHIKNGKPEYGTILFGSRRLYPYAKLSDPMYVLRQPYADTAGAGKLLDWKFYPLDDWKHNTSTTKIQDILANVGLQYQILRGLTAEVRYQYQRQSTQTANLQDIESFAARQLINRFSQLDRNTGIVKYIVPLGGILNNFSQNLETHNGRGQLNFNRDFGQHQIVALLGAEIRQTKVESKTNRFYGYDPEFATVQQVDYINSYRTFINGSNQFVPFVDGAGGTLNRFTSMFGNVAYSFRQTYTVSGSVRKDASNLFGVDANDKGVPLWSAGAAWMISNEKFFQSKFIPFLKLRATYGFSGNVDNSKSAVTTIGIAGPVIYTNFIGAAVSQFGNPDLKWERVKMINMGLDFQLKNGIVTGSIEYYLKKGFDLFGLTPIDYTSGLGTTTIVKNVANMTGNGLDVSLNAKILNRKIVWQQSFNLSLAQNKVSKYFQQSYRAGDYVNEGSTIAPLEGKPVYSILSFRWMGLDPSTGDPQGFYNKQVSKSYGDIVNDSVASLIYNGSAIPTAFGNFSNTVSWKNLSLTFNITYKFGYYFRRESLNYDALFNSGVGHSDYSLRWKNPGDEKVTDVPSFIYPNNSQRDYFYSYSEALITKGDHIRLQFVNLSYDINKSMWKSLPFDRLRLTINASNLGVIWRSNKYDLDPDYIGSVLPPGKAFNVGLNATF